VTSIVFWEEVTEAGNEPMSGWDFPLGSEPQFRLNWEKAITGVKVGEETGVWVRGTVMLFNDDSVTLKGGVTFVRWEEKGEVVGIHFDSVTKGNFAVISVFQLVWIDKFSEMEEGMKTG
jgi:hypothetical protein